ncbi:MAG: ATP-binding protein, partial [Clostridiales bacterium]
MLELSLNILDIAQNSVRAEASLIEISIEENHDSDTLSIMIKDDGYGMDEKQAASVIDPFFTTRTTRAVGLGVPFFKMAAELSGGSFDIKSQKGQGTEVKAVFGLNHIDRMPLGDMTSTVVSLIQCNPNIDFVYTYQLNDKSFVADTRQFREVLEGIPLNSPQVLQ